MKTSIRIIKADGTEEVRDFAWPEAPGYAAIRDLVEPILGQGRYLEHVTVLHEGERTDMFVDDSGLTDGLPRNEKATAIYRANWLSQHPGCSPEALPFIAGDAILFSRRVWF